LERNLKGEKIMSFARGDKRRDGRDRNFSLNSSDEIKSEQNEESYGGLPFLSGNSTNKNSKGVESPPNDLSLEKQNAILFTGPGGQTW
jgi:hypothetical protein